MHLLLKHYSRCVPSEPFYAPAVPKSPRECFTNGQLLKLDNVYEKVQESTDWESRKVFDPKARIEPDKLNTSIVEVKRSISVPSTTEISSELSPEICNFKRSISAPFVCEQVEKEACPADITPPELNGVSLYYSFKTERIVLSPGGENLVLLTNSQKIRRCSSFRAHVSVMRTQSVRSLEIIRSYTARHIETLVRDLPFSDLLRSHSLETEKFYQSAKQFRDTKQAMDKLAKPRHRFYGGQMAASGRVSLMRRAYPELKCHHCPRTFQGNDRKRRLARHVRKVHPSRSSSQRKDEMASHSLNKLSIAHPRHRPSVDDIHHSPPPHSAQESDARLNPGMTSLTIIPEYDAYALPIPARPLEHFAPSKYPFSPSSVGPRTPWRDDEESTRRSNPVVQPLPSY